jgi:hypothetical protein
MGLFGKRPYLYKATDQSISLSKFNVLYPNENNRNGYNTGNHLAMNNPVHWIDWLDSGMEFFGCGITTPGDVMSSEDENSSSRYGHGYANSLQDLQREQDILARKKRHQELLERDYAQLHEDFFDSLLKEEGDQMLASVAAATMSLQRTESGSVSVNAKSSSSFDAGSVASSASETNRTVDAQNSGDSSGHTRTSTKSGPSVSSTRTICNRRGSVGKNSRSISNSTTFEVYDEEVDPATSSKNAKSAASSSSSTAGKQSSSSILCIRDIMAKTELESPALYLHTKCKLQKDKGRGDRLGSSISARGRESTLSKLRDKMKLIVEVSGELQAASFQNKDLASVPPPSTSNGNTPSGYGNGFKAMSAGMKRRRAKISSIEQCESCMDGAEDGSYMIETRSMIELQLGFLSMQYGLLLRWDAYRTGQVVFVCLRKMCHDSFYTKIRSPPVVVTTTSTTRSLASKSTRGDSSTGYPKSTKKQRPLQPLKNENDLGKPPRMVGATKKHAAAPPLVVRSPKGGNHAIYQRASGATEVVLVDAPYRVPHPEVFAPSILSLDVHRLTGLDPKSRWTLIMTFDGDTEIAHLKYNYRERVFETTRTDPCKWEISMMPYGQTISSFDVSTGLEIRLFEQRPKHRLRGVANGVAGIVGVRSSSSFVPPGSDPFSLTSPSNSYLIENQRLYQYPGSGSSHSGSRRISRSNSEISLASTNTSATTSTGGSGSDRHSSKKSTSRLASTMTVPLGGLICQPSTSQTTLWKLTIPFTHDEDAEVTLTLMHQSDYAHWLYQELRARRKDELASTSPSSTDLWRLLVSTATNEDEGVNSDDDTDTDDSDDTDVYFMEWLYYCCFDPR